MSGILTGPRSESFRGSLRSSLWETLLSGPSAAHTDHRFRPADEHAQDHREDLQRSLKHLQGKQDFVKKVRLTFDQTAERIKVQGRHTERQIKEPFKKLHQFLVEEKEKGKVSFSNPDSNTHFQTHLHWQAVSIH